MLHKKNFYSITILLTTAFFSTTLIKSSITAMPQQNNRLKNGNQRPMVLRQPMQRIVHERPQNNRIAAPQAAVTQAAARKSGMLGANQQNNTRTPVEALTIIRGHYDPSRKEAVLLNKEGQVIVAINVEEHKYGPAPKGKMFIGLIHNPDFKPNNTLLGAQPAYVGLYAEKHPLMETFKNRIGRQRNK